MNYHRGNDQIKQKVNFVGNNAKSLQNSVTTSLKQLRTSYIDILYLHWWDWDTSIEEVMDSMHNLVLQGKVLYLVRGPESAYTLELILFQGNLRHACMGGRSGQPVRSGSWKDAVCDLSRSLECHGPLLRA